MCPISYSKLAGIGLLIASSAICQPLVPAPVAPMPTVGTLGLPAALEFEGNASFPAPVLREALAGVPEFLLTGHPAAALEPYVATITLALTRGYLRSGFPAAAIAAAPDAARKVIIVKITEGPRFRQGEVRVTGAQDIPAAELVRALTEVSPNVGDPLVAAMETVLAQWRAPKLRREAEEKARELSARLPTAQIGALPAPVGNPAGDFLAQLNADADAATATAFWERGKPAAFDVEFARQAEEKARAVLAERGHPLATVKAALQRDPAAGVAHLVLQVQEGPPAVLGELRVSGNRLNTREEILAATGLAPGQPLTPAALTRAKLALWNSARFYSFDVTAVPRTPLVREVDVSIELEEIETMPQLREPLSRLQTALVKFANWMTTQARQREMAASFPLAPGLTLDVAHSPGQGLLLEAVAKDGARLALAAGPAGSRALIAGGGRSAGREFGGMALDSTVSVHLITVPDTTGDGTHAQINFSFAKSSFQARRGVPMQVDLIVSPSLAVTKFGDLPPAFEGADVVALRLADDAGRVRFHEATGELIEFAPTLSGEEASKLRIGGTDFARLQKSFDTAWAALPPAGAARESFVGVLLAQPEIHQALKAFDANLSSGRLAVAATLLERLVESPRFAAWWARYTAVANDFFIPPDPATSAQPNAMAVLLGAYFYQLATMLGAADAWPGKLGREIFHLLVGETRHTAAVLDELHADPQMGPMGSFVTAQLLARLAPPESARFLQRVLTRSATADFRHDWQLLFGEDTELGRLAQDALRSLGSLSEAEAGALAAGLAEEEASHLRRALAALREGKDRPVTQVLQPFLDEWWEQDLRPQVERMRVAALPIATPAQVAAAVADCTRVIENAASGAALRATALVKRARAQWGNTGRPDSALADLNRAIDTPGTMPDTLAEALMLRASVSVLMGQFDHAITDATRTLAMPECQGEILTAALGARSIAYRMAKRPAEALADLTRLISLFSANPEMLVKALVDRGDIHAEQGRKAEAAADYNRILQLPDLPGGLRGQIRAKLLFVK